MSDVVALPFVPGERRLADLLFRCRFLDHAFAVSPLKIAIFHAQVLSLTLGTAFVAGTQTGVCMCVRVAVVILLRLL